MTSLFNKIIQRVIYENPAASKEKIEAITFSRMYTKMREEWEVRTGRKEPEKSLIQVKRGDQLMNDEEIIQKIKDSYNGIREPRKKIKKQPWINYEYFHPGQWVFFYFIFIERISN